MAFRERYMAAKRACNNPNGTASCKLKRNRIIALMACPNPIPIPVLTIATVHRVSKADTFPAMIAIFGLQAFLGQKRMATTRSRSGGWAPKTRTIPQHEHKKVTI